MLKGKKVIIIGDKDGVPGPVIEACVKSAGAEVIYNTTECFGCALASVINAELQEQILSLVQAYGKDNSIVLLGGSQVEITEQSAETLISGDSVYGGPMKGVALRLDVYHAMENEIKVEYDQAVYNEQCGVLEMILEVEELCSAVKNLRNR